jgi:hypothetical protein
MDLWNDYLKRWFYAKKKTNSNTNSNSDSNTDSDTDSSSENERDIFEEIAPDGSVITDSGSITSDITTSGNDSDTSIDYSVRFQHLPYLIPFVKSNEDTNLIMVYNSGGSTELNFRCRHSSRAQVFATALPGFMYWCLCHAHGEKGLEYNLNICPPKRHALLPISSKEGWRRNYMIYWLRKIPTLFQLALANVFGSDQMHYLENSNLCPKEILDKKPKGLRQYSKLKPPISFDPPELEGKTIIYSRYFESFNILDESLNDENIFILINDVKN